MVQTVYDFKQKSDSKSIINLLEIQKKKRLYELTVLADSYFQIKEYDKCIDIYLQLLEQYDFSRFHMEIAKCKRLKGDFSVEAHEYFQKAIELSGANDALIIYEYFAFLLDSSKITKKTVLKYYQQNMFDKLKPLQQLLIASALFQVNEKERALKEVLKIYYSDSREALLRFANLIFLLNNYKYILNNDEKTLLSIYRKTKSNQKKFKTLVEKNHIGIVGNSPCENGKSQGNKIDSFDLVARFNNYHTLKNKTFKKDYGEKSDIWMRSIGDWVIKKDINNFKVVIISGLNLLARSTNWLYFKEYFEKNTLVTIMPNQYEKELIEYLESPPSAGISLLYYLYKTQGKLDIAATYGFSFTDQLKENFVNIGGTIAGSRHECDKENEQFEKMLNNEI